MFIVREAELNFLESRYKALGGQNLPPLGMPKSFMTNNSQGYSTSI